MLGKSTIVALSALAGQAYAAAASVNTPTSLIQCQPYQLSWTAGEGGPYYLSVIPGGQASATPIEQLGTFPEGTTTFTWTVNVPAGTDITIQIVDKSGQPNYSDQATILAGSSSCDLVAVDGSDASVTATGPAGGASSATAAASTTQGGLNTPRTTPAGSSTGASRSSSETPSGTNSAAASQSSAPASGAGSLKVGGVAAGVVALAAGLMM